MSDKHLKIFLIGWLMEFGVHHVSSDTRRKSIWYMGDAVPVASIVSMDREGKNYLKK